MAPQRIEHRLGQWHQPLLIALADDAQYLVGPVDGADLQRGGLAHAQAAGMHDGKASLVSRVADCAEPAANLVLGPVMIARRYTYGGVYIGASLAWLWGIEGVRPDRWDTIGATVCFVGAVIILFGSRATSS